MVIDWWNLKKDEVGGVGYCYYAMGNKPHYYDDNHEKKEIDEAPFNMINKENYTLKNIQRFNIWLQHSKALSNTDYNVM